MLNDFVPLQIGDDVQDSAKGQGGEVHCGRSRRLLTLLLLWASWHSVAHSQTVDLRDAYRQHALQHAGEPGAGERLFQQNEKLVCTSCHGITGVEKSGPNLEGIADKYSRAEIIRHILEPSAAIKPGYELAAFVMRDGRVFEGRVIRATKEMYRFIDAKGKSRDIQRANVEELRGSTKSMMPDNLVASVTRQEFADLVAYLETLHARSGAGLVASDQPVEIPRLAAPVRIRVLGESLSFENPVWCGAVPGLPGELAVIEHQEARIWRLKETPTGVQKRLFLNLSGQVKYGNNWGLMCMAFHPQFAMNRRYFLEHEVQEGGVVKTVVVERLASADLLTDSGAESVRLLEVEQPAFNHNGGCIAFGGDGMLYAAFGDGGPQRDPNGYCQNPRILHGSIARIDVDHRDVGKHYAVPPDNPFITAHREDPNIRPETWAIGFREPWRFSFDSETGALWLGDVGQDKYEEVCLVRRGQNHGWNVFEAYEPFSEVYRRADESYTPPIFAYHHRLGVSITGGHVYRGRQSPSFQGVYIFGDYETRRIWGLRLDGERVDAIRELGESPEHIASFGTDARGELFFVGYEGSIFHLDLSETEFE